MPGKQPQKPAKAAKPASPAKKPGKAAKAGSYLIVRGDGETRPDEQIIAEARTGVVVPKFPA
jgi:hypothetical protein